MSHLCYRILKNDFNRSNFKHPCGKPMYSNYKKCGKI